MKDLTLKVPMWAMAADLQNMGIFVPFNHWGNGVCGSVGLWKWVCGSVVTCGMWKCGNGCFGTLECPNTPKNEVVRYCTRKLHVLHSMYCVVIYQKYDIKFLYKILVFFLRYLAR